MRGLYAIIDPGLCAERDPQQLAEAVLAGGCCALQLRDKHCSDAEYSQLALPMMAACRRAKVPFVVNDRVEVAVALKADGLHLGQGDTPLSEARRLAAGIPIGISTHNLDQLAAAIAGGASLAGFGPIFATGSKLDPDATVGTKALATAWALSSIPLVAIGGITAANIDSVVSAGVRVAAVIGALASAPDPTATARQLHCALGGSSGGS